MAVNVDVWRSPLNSSVDETVMVAASDWPELLRNPQAQARLCCLHREKPRFSKFSEPPRVLLGVRARMSPQLSEVRTSTTLCMQPTAGRSTAKIAEQNVSRGQWKHAVLKMPSNVSRNGSKSDQRLRTAPVPQTPVAGRVARASPCCVRGQVHLRPRGRFCASRRVNFQYRNQRPKRTHRREVANRLGRVVPTRIAV
jgi:hypothetical protein